MILECTRPDSSIVILGMFDAGIFTSYRVYFSSPERINAPTSTRPARSRVVVAGGVSAMVLYFFAGCAALYVVGSLLIDFKSAEGR